MNYLIVEGYKDTADNFVVESRLSFPFDNTSMSCRNLLRKALLNGDIETAIDLLNDSNPELLDDNPALTARLRMQELAEAIRSIPSGDLNEVIRYAREQTAPVLLLVSGEEQEELRKEFCRIMALLLVPQGGKAPGSLEGVLDTGKRQKLAGLVNASILEASGQETEAILPRLLSMQKEP